ncbi:LPXTG cell wall anchor domain-containing protein [Kitasatospora cineracea]
MAETTPTGQSTPDAAVPDTEPAAPATPDAPAESAAPSAPAPAVPVEPAAPIASETPTAPEAPAAPVLDEAALRARLATALAEPGHYDHYYKTVKEAQAGTAEQIQHFLDVELSRVVLDDNNLKASQILSSAEHGTPLWQAAQDAFDDGSPEAIAHFLHVTVPDLTNSDNRVKLAQFIADPLISAGLRAEALAVLERGDSAEIAAYLGKSHVLMMDDYRIQVVRSMSFGPEVRKAANAALDADMIESMHGDRTATALRAFLSKGLAEAQARDRAAAEQGGKDTEQPGEQPSKDGSGTTQAGLTTTTATTTATGSTIATGTGTTAAQLASTGTDAPVRSLTAGGAAAIALGAGALVVARRRSRES